MAFRTIEYSLEVRDGQVAIVCATCPPEHAEVQRRPRFDTISDLAKVLFLHDGQHTPEGTESPFRGLPSRQDEE